MPKRRPTTREKYGKQKGNAPGERTRGTRHERGYDKHHEKWRRVILARDPICVHCNRAPATEADHIQPISRGGERFDLENGQGLCKPCHARKTIRERSG